MQGQVVRAVRGDRRNYRPIVSMLCRSSDPVEVARTLCSHCASKRLYVADLDALQGGAVQREVLREILAALPGLELWLDAGFADADGNPIPDGHTAVIRVDLSELAGDATQMTITTTWASDEAMEQALATGMQAGITAAVGQIDALLNLPAQP